MTAISAYRPLAGLGADRRDQTSSADLLRPYALDPFKHLHDGHVKILDVVTLQPVTFRPWPHQVELAAAWIDLAFLAEHGFPRWNNVHEDKSRQMGMSWMCAWCELWALTYHPFPGLAMHIDFNEVDDGGSGSTTDSFAGRIRYMHERMPPVYKAPLSFKLGKISHQFEPTAYLELESAGPDPGRGGRYARVLLDEAARIQFGEAAHSALSRACPRGRLYNSTPKGEGNVFFRLRKTRPQGYTFLTHHWSIHPLYGRGLHLAALPDLDSESQPQEQPQQPTGDAERLAAECSQCRLTRQGFRWSADNPVAHRFPGKVTSPWYEEAILDLTDEQVASELDIDYQGSAQARVYHEFDENVHVAPYKIPLAREVAVELAFDYGTDTTAVVVLQDLPEEVRVIGEVEVYKDAHPDTVVPEIIRALRNLGVEERLLTEIWTSRMRCIGDPAGDAKQQATGRPLTAEYQRLGFRIEAPRNRSILDTMTSVKRLLHGRPKRLIVSGPDCPLFVDHMKNNKWPTDRDGNRKPGSTEPVNDRHNHMMRAFAYWAVYTYPPGTTSEDIADATGRSSEDDFAAIVMEEAQSRRPGLSRGTRL